MTDVQLDEIERELEIRLPTAYRRVSLEFPFKPIGRDWVYWLYDEPQRVIYETRFPLEDGEYDRAGWKSDYVVIGNSGAGDLYVMDTGKPEGSVLILSHETHEIEEEWPTFADFVADWLKTQEELNRKESEREEASRAERKRNLRFLIVFLIILGLAIAAMIALIIDHRETLKATKQTAFREKVDMQRITRLY